MSTTIKAIYADGVFKPLDTVELKSGDKVTITYEVRKKELTVDEKLAIIDRTAGAWAESIDCEEFKRVIYESRERGSRDRFRR